MNKSSHEPSNPPHGPVGSVAADDTPGGAAEEARLIARAQAGDSRSFDALVTMQRGRVYAMIRNMIHNETEAWDLAQEVFIKAWQALPRFEAKARFSTWLYRIAHNVVYDHARKRKIEGAGELNDEVFAIDRIDPASTTTPDMAEAPDEALARAELRAKIEAALARLSPEQRAVVVLKDVQGLAYKEIAEVVGTSLGTVMSRLFYARQKLQTLLKDEYEHR
jgi:RNA polymerase sigma-70 factor (ECF subfamily)